MNWKTVSLSCALLLSGALSLRAAEKPPLAGKRVLMVIAPKDFRDEELATPKKLLEEAGANVEIASTKKGLCTGMLGARAEATRLVKDVKPEEYAAIVFVGGSGATMYFEDKDVRGLARAGVEKNTIVAAICIAPVILAKEGLLKGKRATVWRDMSQTLIENGAQVVKMPVVTDGRIITGNGPDAAHAFGQAIVKALKESGG